MRSLCKRRGSVGNSVCLSNISTRPAGTAARIGLDVIVALMQYTMPQYFSADSHSCDCFVGGQKFNGAVKPDSAERNQIKSFRRRARERG